MKKLNLITIITLSMITLLGCSKAEPVARSECGKVIKHVKNVLGSKAPSHREMTQQCNDASDEARGCALAADKPMKLLQCDL